MSTLAHTPPADAPVAPGAGSSGTLSTGDRDHVANRDFALLLVQFVLLVVVVWQFQLEKLHHLPALLILAGGGFVLHSRLPVRFRLAVFVLLSIGAIVLVLGPLARLTLVAGHHRVEVRAAGHLPAVHDLHLADGDDRRLDVDLEPGEAVAEIAAAPMDEVIAAPVRGPEVYEEWWFWTILGGAVVVAVGVGVGVGIAVGSSPPPVPDPTGIELPGIR